jgi:CRP-like cAMP-binding protein
MTSQNNPGQNRILSALPPLILDRLSPDLELVFISAGERIYEPGIPITYLYFPIDFIAISIRELAGGETFQTSITGNEGMVGISFLLGSENAQLRTVALSAGIAFRIKASLLKREFSAGGELRDLLLRFIHALLAQTALIATAARHYSIEQQLCIFLLMCLDRLPGNKLCLTHDQLSVLLGSRRESVSMAARKLGVCGAIHYRRGRLTVLNRQELEYRAGKSYALLSKEYRLGHESFDSRVMGVSLA